MFLVASAATKLVVGLWFAREICEVEIPVLAGLSVLWRPARVRCKLRAASHAASGSNLARHAGLSVLRRPAGEFAEL